MTYDEMLLLLQKGGIDTETFDAISRKTLVQLYEEVQSRDVVLLFNEKTQRVIRCALTVAILIRVPSEGYQLRETGREFRNGTAIHILKEWSMSETCKRGEEMLQAASRGIREELGLEVDPLQFMQATKIWQQDFLSYESTAYSGIRSHVMVQRLMLDLPERPWKEMTRVIEDNGTRVHLAWIPAE